MSARGSWKVLAPASDAACSSNVLSPPVVIPAPVVIPMRAPSVAVIPTLTRLAVIPPTRATRRRVEKPLAGFCEIGMAPVRTVRRSRPIRRAVRSSPSAYGIAAMSRVRGRPLAWRRMWCSLLAIHPLRLVEAQQEVAGSPSEAQRMASGPGGFAIPRSPDHPR